jgi:hypothetical protein
MYQYLAGVSVLTLFIVGPMLISPTYFDSNGVVYDGTDASLHEAMGEVIKVARENSSVAFKALKIAALHCAGGRGDSEYVQRQSANAVAEVFQRTLSYSLDPENSSKSMDEIAKFSQKVMIGKVKSMSNKGSHDDMTMAIGLQNISFASTQRCVFLRANGLIKGAQSS